MAFANSTPATNHPSSNGTGHRKLSRTLTLPLMVLYGLGVTIGAGIYVLIGATTAVAGVHAPWAFVLAALVMLPSACSFAELVGRYPVSAGEAAYVRAGFERDWLSVLTGLGVVTVGTVSAAAICIGATGYVRQFIDLPQPHLVVVIVFLMASIAAVGVRESVSFAAVMTIIEITGLLAVVAGGVWLVSGGTEGLAPALAQPAGPVSTPGQVWPLAVLSASVLAFFAFVGFEDLVNMAEETKAPERTLPAAIFITLALSTLLYVLVSWVAVSTVSVAELGASQAPLSLVFERATGLPPGAISAIAIVATLNGVIVQIIMASRVLYGLSRQGAVPAFFGTVNPLTHTPVRSTAIVAAVVLVLALAAPMTTLAEATSAITLSIFALVNVALLRIKHRGDVAPGGTFLVPTWVPMAGAACSVGLFLASFL